MTDLKKTHPKNKKRNTAPSKGKTNALGGFPSSGTGVLTEFLKKHEKTKKVTKPKEPIPFD